MLKKVFFVFLIICSPIQLLAASQMPFQHSLPESHFEVTEASDHHCHQDIADSVVVDNLAPSQSDGCNSCTLCMAFAFFSFHPSIAVNQYSVTFKKSSTSFESYDVLGLIKPPIL